MFQELHGRIDPTLELNMDIQVFGRNDVEIPTGLSLSQDVFILSFQVCISFAECLAPSRKKRPKLSIVLRFFIAEFIVDQIVFGGLPKNKIFLHLAEK